MPTKIFHLSVERPRRLWGKGAGGFTLIELLIVVAIGMVLMAIAVPNFLTASYEIRLKSACSDLSGFMQLARIQAARSNATLTIVYQVANGVQEAYVDLNGNGVLDAGEPVVTFNRAVRAAPGAPNGAGGTPTPYVLVGDTAGVTYDNTTTLAYSPRGLPCALVGGVCSTPAAGYFVYYLTDQRPTSVGWGAVVVTRAGRTKTIIWNGVAWK